MIVIIAILEGAVNNFFSKKDRHGFKSGKRKNRVSDFPCCHPGGTHKRNNAQMPDS
jgi:hypothetical protein